MGEQAHQYTFINREFGIDAGDLKRPGDAEVASAIGWQIGDLSAFE